MGTSVVLGWVMGVLATAGASGPTTDHLVFVGAATDTLGNPRTAIYRIKADGAGRQRVTEPGHYRKVSVSSLGGKLAYMKRPVVYVCDWDGGHEVKVRPVAREHFLPQWSPDGRGIAFVSDLTNDAELWLMNADGSSARNLSWSMASAELDPAWSPDGKRLAFISNRRGPYQLFAMDLATSQVRCIAPNLSNCREPAWSPDGRRIAFACVRNGNRDLYTITPDGKDLERLTRHAGWDGHPAWDATAGRLAFVSDRDGMADVFVMTLGERRPRNVTRTPREEESFPAWAPKLLSPTPLAIAKANVSSLDLPRPRFLITPKTLPALRRKVTSEPYAAAWKALVAKCDAWADPKSKANEKLMTAIDAIPGGFQWSAPWQDALYTLAFAYQASGDEKYGRAAVPMFMRVCRHLADHAEQPVIGLWKYRADRASATYDWLHALLTPGQRQKVRNLFRNSCRVAYQSILTNPLGLGPGWGTYGGVSNFSVFMAYSIGAPAIVMAGESGFDPNWLAAALKMTELTADRWFDKSGACAEGAAYFVWPVNGTMGYLATIDMLGLTDCLRKGRIANWPNWFAISSGNGLRTMISTGDAYNSPPRVPPGFLSIYSDNPLVDLLWARGANGASPQPTVESLLWWRPVQPSEKALAGLPRAAVFDAPGYAVMRSGYGDDDPLLVAAASSGSGHSHAETGALQLIGYGASFIVETGYGDPHAASHSQVLVNGQGRPHPASHVDAPVFKGFVHGTFGAGVQIDVTRYFDARAEGHLDYRVPLPGYPMRRFVRYAAMVADDGDVPPYFLVCDDVDRNGEPNLYTSQFIAERGRRIVLGDADPHTAVIAPLYTGPCFAPTPLPRKGNGKLSFPFKVDRAGRYAVWLFVRNDGRSHYRMFVDGKFAPAGEFRFQSRTAGQWQWRPLRLRKEPVVLDLPSGKHTIAFLLPPYAHIPHATLSRILLVPEGASSAVPFAPDAPEAAKGAILLTTAHGAITGQGWVRHDATREGERALIAFLRPNPPKFEKGFHRMRMSHGAKDVNLFNRLRANRRAVNPRFVTWLYPHRRGMEMPAIQRAEHNGLLVTTLRWNKAVDTVLSAPTGQVLSANGFTTDAPLAVVRLHAKGGTSWLILNGARLKAGGRDLVKEARPACRIGRAR